MTAVQPAAKTAAVHNAIGEKSYPQVSASPRVSSVFPASPLPTRKSGSELVIFEKYVSVITKWMKESVREKMKVWINENLLPFLAKEPANPQLSATAVFKTVPQYLSHPCLSHTLSSWCELVVCVSDYMRNPGWYEMHSWRSLNE